MEEFYKNERKNFEVLLKKTKKNAKEEALKHVQKKHSDELLVVTRQNMEYEKKISVQTKQNADLQKKVDEYEEMVKDQKDRLMDMKSKEDQLRNYFLNQFK